MSDVLVRPDGAGHDDEPRRGDDPAAAPGAERAPDAPDAAESVEVGAPDAGMRPIRLLLAALLLGAGAIHVAMAPSHLGESAVEGTGFLVAAWAQVGLALVLLSRRPLSRVLLGAISATSVVLVAVWAWSRTAGLPFGAHSGHAESVSVVDGACVALEILAAVIAALLLTRLGAITLGAIGVRARGVALVAAVAALGLATGAIASPDARDHASASHGTHAEGGHAHGTAAANGDDLGFSELSNGHQHEHTTDEPLTARDRVTLARQIAATSELVERYPTLGDAEAAGWTRAGPFSPGLGTHYMSPDIARSAFGGDAGTMDPDNMPTPMLVFDGLDADAPLAGFMYQAYGVEGEPSGFAGPNDHWHYHQSVCIKMEGGVLTAPLGADLEGVTEGMCTDIGGQWIETTGYMVHMWSVPGYESPDGMFTELNPKITCPDGTYHRIDIAETGNRESVCRNA
jgi:hypothetical protein